VIEVELRDDDDGNTIVATDEISFEIGRDLREVIPDGEIKNLARAIGRIDRSYGAVGTKDLVGGLHSTLELTLETPAGNSDQPISAVNGLSRMLDSPARLYEFNKRRTTKTENITASNCQKT